MKLNTKIVNSALNVFKNVILQQNKFRPVIITGDQASKSYFCFVGEFGNEMASWIPYLLFLKKKLKIKINTIGRPGSRIFYYFSDNHIEVNPEDIGYVWGEKSVYQQLEKRFPRLRLIYPYGDQMTCQREITVGGYSWMNRNIHKPIIKKNYSPPNYSSVRVELPFVTKKPIVIINNKYYVESSLFPTNYYNPNELTKLRDLFHRHGFFVVYNRFIEKTGVDEHLNLNDSAIFSVKNTFDMTNFYNYESDPENRNLVQISLFNSAKYIIGVQGGNIYIPAILGKEIYMLMRQGEYIDYKELEKLYHATINTFYEPDQLLLWLENRVFSR